MYSLDTDRMPHLTGFGNEVVPQEESTISLLPKTVQYVSSNATHFRILKDCASVEHRQFVMPSPDYRSSTECGTAQTLEEKRGVSTELKPEPPRTKRGVLRPRGSLCPEKRQSTPDSDDSDSSDTAADTRLERETAASVRNTAEFKKPILGSVGLGQKDWRVAFPPSEVELSGNPASVPNSSRVPKHAHPELAMSISHIDIAGRAGAGPFGPVKPQGDSELTVRESSRFKEKLWPEAGCAPGASRQTLLNTTLRNPAKTPATQAAAWGQASGLTLRLIPSAMDTSVPTDEDSCTPPLCGMSLEQSRAARSQESSSSHGSVMARSLTQESHGELPSRGCMTDRGGHSRAPYSFRSNVDAERERRGWYMNEGKARGYTRKRNVSDSGSQAAPRALEFAQRAVPYEDALVRCPEPSPPQWPDNHQEIGESWIMRVNNGGDLPQMRAGRWKKPYAHASFNPERPRSLKPAQASNSRVSTTELERTEQLNQLLNASMLSSYPRAATPNWLKGAHFPDFTESIQRGRSTRRGQETVYATVSSVGSQGYD